MVRSLATALGTPVLTLGLALGSASSGLAADYTIDSNHSKILFKVRHLGISSVTGRFEKFSGGFSFDSANPAAFKADVTIDTASVNTDVADRDNHLRSPDFFDATTNPQMTFVATGIKEVAKNKYEVSGNLTMRGATKPVVLQAELGGIAKDQRGNQRIAFTASGTINRKDFGVSWSRVLDGGGLVVSDEVQLMIEIEAVEKKTS